MKMIILGIELEYDFFDADLLDKYEDANQRVQDRIQEPTQYEGLRTGDALRVQCNIVNDFFDEVFGDGTADKIFGGKSNIKDHMEAFAQVADAAMSCKGELDQITDKYAPNRAERRAEARQQGKQQSTNFNRNNAAHHGKGKHSHYRNK